MGKYDKPDNQIEGQMTLEDIYKPPERMFAVSRIFARARKEMSLPEQKTFVYALSELKFKEVATTNVVRLDKKVLARIIGLNSNTDHLSGELYNSIKDLPKHSYIQIDEKDIDLQSSGFLVSSVTRFKNVIRLRLNEEYMGLFTGLSTEYITMWSADIFQMKSKRTVQFYEYLRQITDDREEINTVLLGVKAIKEMFSMPLNGEGSYIKSNGHFNRAEFEKKVIQSLCDDLKGCRMINLVVQPDGKMYEKVKQGNRVMGYRFFWTFTSHPAIATAAEVKELQDRVDKNPVVLKVAKDIVSGKPKPEKEKPEKKPTGTKFTNYPEREYTQDHYADLERQQIRAILDELDKK